VSTQEAGVKLSLPTTSAIVVLALALWVFFYVTSERLTSAETTVVVGLCAAIVLGSKWCWTRLSKTRDKQ
jgi:hypothetical protein